MSCLIVKHDRLPVRANHKIIRVGDNKRLVVAHDDPNRFKWVGLHQFLDLIGDHWLNLVEDRAEGNLQTAGFVLPQAPARKTASHLRPPSPNILPSWPVSF